MRVQKDRRLTHGHIIAEDEKLDKLWHRFYLNENYDSLACLIVVTDTKLLDEAFEGRTRFSNESFFAHQMRGSVECLNHDGIKFDRQCDFIILNGGPDIGLPMTHGTIAHECYHALYEERKSQGETNEGVEQFTYYLEWLTDMIYEDLFGTAVIDKKKWIPAQ